MKVEITHDIIAQKVGEKVSAEDKKIRRVEKFIHDSFETYLSRGTNAFLSKDDLEYIKPFLNKLFLSEEEKDWLEKSQENILYKREKNIHRISVLSILIVILSSGSYFSSKIAETKNKELNENKNKNETTKKENEIKKTDLERNISELKAQEESLIIRKKEIETVKQMQVEMLKESQKKKEENERIKSELNDIREKSKIIKDGADKQKKEFEIEETHLSEKLKEISEKLSLIKKQEEEREEKELSTVIEGKEWSNNLGSFDWNTAVKKCEELDRGDSSNWRLPSVLEYKAMYKYKQEILVSWRTEGEKNWARYWTKEIFNDGTAYNFLNLDGNIYISNKENNLNVRCIR